VKMASNSVGTVSVLGVNLLEPTLELIERLEAAPAVEPNEVQAGPLENGLSCGIVTLTALLLESAINRTRYIRREICDDDIVDYFVKVTSERELGKDIDEVIAIRDAVVHNHLWEADVYWGEDRRLRFKTPPNLLEGFGNKRQRRVMDPKTRQSRRLGLNLYPLRIWRVDAYTSLRVVARALEALEAKDRNYFYISRHPFEFRGGTSTLRQVIDTLP